MSTQKLATVLQVVNLNAGGTTTIPHGLKVGGKGVAPTQVICDRASPIAVTGYDTLGVTFTNIGPVMASAGFRVEYDHSIHAVDTAPLAWQGWDGTARPVGPASGDLAGQYPGPTVVGLNTYPLDLTAPAAGDYLRFDGTTWQHTNVAPVAQTAIYGCFSSSVEQPLTTGLHIVTFNTTEASNGVSLVGGTKLVVAESGVYAVNLSPQLAHSGGATEIIKFWVRLDGSNLPNSASSLEMGNNNNRTLPFFETTLPLNAGQYIEWAFTAGTGTDIKLEVYPANGIVPFNPSVVANVKRLGNKP